MNFSTKICLPRSPRRWPYQRSPSAFQSAEAAPTRSRPKERQEAGNRGYRDHNRGPTSTTGRKLDVSPAAQKAIVDLQTAVNGQRCCHHSGQARRRAAAAKSQRRKVLRRLDSDQGRDGGQGHAASSAGIEAFRRPAGLKLRHRWPVTPISANATKRPVRSTGGRRVHKAMAIDPTQCRDADQARQHPR